MTSPTPNAMPGATAPNPPAVPPATNEAPPVTPPATPPAADPPKPPWGSDEEFDPQRAWSLIQNLKNVNADLKAKTDPIVAEHEAQRLAALSAQDRLQEDLDKTAARELTWRDKAVQGEAKALAAGKFVHTQAALKLAGDLSEFATEDGVDTVKLTARLEELAQEYPFLVAQATPPPGFTPNRGQGQSGTGQIPIDAQIDAAQKAGNFALSIALKQQKHAQQNAQT